MTLWKWSQTANSNSNSDSTIDYAEGQAPSTLNNSARAAMAAMAKYRDDVSGNLVTAGTSTAYTLTTSQTLTALTDGFKVAARMSATNGATPTLNVDTLGAKAIQSVSGTAIATGVLLSGGVYAFVYDSSADAWIVHSAPGAQALGTGDSPQFAGVNVGHASDTTITRTGAGDIAVEGNAVYRAGGTDVPLADGGTGASLVDPNADRVLFWDDSAGAVTWLTAGSGLTITNTTITADVAAVAAQSDMETASSTTLAVTPGRQHFHPGHPKAWGRADAAGNLLGSYGVTSVTDVGTGRITWTWSTAFSSANYSVTPSLYDTDVSAFVAGVQMSAIAAGSASARVSDSAGNAFDPDGHLAVALGDHA